MVLVLVAICKFGVKITSSFLLYFVSGGIAPMKIFFCHILFEFAKHFHESHGINDNLNVNHIKE